MGNYGISILLCRKKYTDDTAAKPLGLTVDQVASRNLRTDSWYTAKNGENSKPKSIDDFERHLRIFKVIKIDDVG